MVDNWMRQLDRLHEGLRERGDPAELVAETDAVEASQRYPQLAVRGPVFGVAALDPTEGARWRVITPVVDGAPQRSRDALHSMLWFRAKDDTDDPEVRRELLAAVSVLEREPVNEVSALGVRYRIVRGDECTRAGEEGLEPPRPTDREPLHRSWDDRRDSPSPDPGFVLDAGREETSLMAGALRVGLSGFAYRGARFPEEVRADSERAVETHPEVLLLPVGFGVIEHDGTGWQPRGALLPTPHDARRMLYDALREFWPLVYELSAKRRRAYARAAEELRAAGRANEVRADGSLFRVCRIERLLRVGPDGPEPPRPSDVDYEAPMKMHPTMDPDGTIHHDA